MSIWAGQTLYTAHKLVLALSSSYFKLVLTGAARGRLPVIFLKDVSSRDFERLLSYMYHGEVSVPQSELLSLIGAARSLGIRGLAEELPQADRSGGKEGRDGRGLKREAEDAAGSKKMKGGAGLEVEEKVSEVLSGEMTIGTTQESDKETAALRPVKDQGGKENDTKPQEKMRDVEKGRSFEKEFNGKEARSVKNYSPFLEVNVKQEEEESPSEESNAISESPGNV